MDHVRDARGHWRCGRAVVGKHLELGPFDEPVELEQSVYQRTGIREVVELPERPGTHHVPQRGGHRRKQNGRSLTRSGTPFPNCPAPICCGTKPRGRNGNSNRRTGFCGRC